MASAPELTPETLVLPKERTYFGLMLAFSLLVWLAVAVTVVGALYGLLIALVVWLANGLLVARLKAEAVRVTEAQLPGLHAAHRAACAALGLAPADTPELYLLQSHGVLNAFATRHGGREFVVLHSDLAEALGHDTAEARFLLGHEIGHIRRGHVLKHVLLLPGFLVPLLGKAYHRACEATCDRFGAYAAGDVDGAVRAMVALAAGKEAMPLVDPRGFAGQYYAERGFFVSWHELNSTYPTLAQRARNLLGLADPAFRRPAERHPLAYPFAFCTLSVGTLLVVYVVAILAALGIPAVNAALKKAKTLQAQQQARAQSQDQAPVPTYQITVPPAPIPPPLPDAPAPPSVPKADDGGAATPPPAAAPAGN